MRTKKRRKVSYFLNTPGISKLHYISNNYLLSANKRIFALFLAIVLVFLQFPVIQMYGQKSDKEDERVSQRANIMQRVSQKSAKRAETKTNYAENELIVKFKTSSATPAMINSKELSPKNTGKSSINKLNKKFSAKKLEKVFKEEAGKNKKDLRFATIYKVKTSKGINIKNAVEEYKKDPNVEYAQPNYRYKKDQIPNDTYYNDLWGMAKIQAPQAWDINTGSSDVVVAVIDTGVDYNHEDLAANMWTNVGEVPGNGIDDDGNGYIDDTKGWDFFNNDNDPFDDHSHGTHVSGTVAGVANNAKGVAGVSWNSRIMALKFLSGSGYGYSSDAAVATRYAADNGAKVINNSWGAYGSPYEDQTLSDALDYAHDNHNVVIVNAAGNSYGDVYKATPANNNNVIAVAATNSADSRASFSNYGQKIDVAAPGVYVKSSIPGNSYANFSGTSMASPHVAGLAALLLSAEPTLNNEEVRQILKSSIDDLGASGWDIYYGAGRINAFKTLSSSSVLKAFIDSPAPLNVTGIIDVKGSASGANFKSYQLEYGSGSNPSSWNILTTSTTPVENSILHNFDTAVLSEGANTLKLTVEDSSGREFSFRSYVIIKNNPSALKNLVSAAKDGKTTLFWQRAFADSGMTLNYEIFRSTTSGSYSSTPIATVSTTSYIDTTVEPGRLYYYKVRAKTNVGITGPYSEEVKAKLGFYWPIEMVSVDSNDAQSPEGGWTPSISADGRFIAFDSSSPLVPDDTNNVWDVYVRDTQANTVTRVSTDSSGNQANAHSWWASISPDGRYIAFASDATNLTVGDNNAKSDVYLKDTQTGQLTRISADSSGTGANGASWISSISADGRYVGFYSIASNLVANDTNGTWDVFVKDTMTGDVVMASTDSSGNPGNGASYFYFTSIISSDGGHIVFESKATNLVQNDTNGKTDIFLKNLQNGTVTRVSTDSDGNQSNNNAWIATISADGRYVTFDSYATNLVDGDTNGKYDVFIKDTQTESTKLVSTDSSGNQGNNNSWWASISPDGRYVAFESAATNFVSDGNNFYNVFVKDLQTDAISVVSTDYSGNFANDWTATQIAISTNASFVTFDSYAANLVENDTNSWWPDIFVTGTNYELDSIVDAGPKTAGDSFNFTVSLNDQFGNPKTDYSGLVSFSSSDILAVLPTDDGTGWVNGQKTFSAILKTAGAQSVTITDDNDSNLVNLFEVSVSPGAPDLINITPSSDQAITAGNTIQFSSSAQDAYGNGLQTEDFTWQNTNALGFFSKTNAGVHQVKASYLGVDSTVVNVTVNPSTLDHINTSPSSAQTITAGDTIMFSAQGQDAYNNDLTGLTYTWTNANASGLFNNTTAGTYQVKASSGGIDSSSVSVVVQPANIDHIDISPSIDQTITAGDTIQFSAQAKDIYDNNTGDTITWTGTDSNGLFVKTTAGTYQVKASSGGVESSIVNVTVNVGALDHINLSPSNYQTIAAGGSISFSTQGQDAYNNDISGLSYSWTNADANGLFSKTATGTYYVKASSGGIDSTQVRVDVAPSNLASFGIGITGLMANQLNANASSIEIGKTFSLTVYAYDTYGNLKSDYAGPISFSSSDGSAILPLDNGSNWISGKKRFNVILNTLGQQNVSLTDSNNLINGSININVIDIRFETLPFILSASHPNSVRYYSNNDVLANFYASDISGISGYSFLIDRNPTSAPDTISEGLSNTVFYNDLANGTWYLHVRAVDNYGNWSNPGHFRLNIDTYKPTTYAPYKHYSSRNSRGVATAKLYWKVFDPYTANYAYVKLKIKKKNYSKTRAAKKAYYYKRYRYYKSRYLFYRTRNRTIAARYYRGARIYFKRYRRVKVYYWSHVKTVDYGWTTINKTRIYRWRLRTPGTYKFYVLSRDQAGNTQRNVASNYIIVRR